MKTVQSEQSAPSAAASSEPLVAMEYLASGETQDRLGSVYVHKITVFVDSDFAGHPVSRKSKTGLVAQIGKHTVTSGSTLQSLTA